MKSSSPALALAVFLGLGVSGVFALGEEKISIGGKAGWDMVGSMDGVVRVSRVRPREVLALSSKNIQNAEIIDMELSFDEKNGKFSDSRGNYTLTVGSRVQSASGVWARQGGGAAVFPGAVVVTESTNRAGSSGGTVLAIRTASNEALFSAGHNLEDFSIEFWLYPVTVESGERILSWNAAIHPIGQQAILCKAVKNRLVWTFDNFFTSPGNEDSIPVSLSAKTAITPKTWSHHKIRFDVLAGTLEYLVNGRLEDVVYTTRSGEGGPFAGEIYTPLVGERGSLILGERYNGILDEFVVKRSAGDDERAPGRYKPEGGSFRTKPVVTGSFDSAVLQVNAKGGHLLRSVDGVSRNTATSVSRRQDEDFKFANSAQIAFFLRSADDAFMLKWEPWTAFTPGSPLTNVKGRFVEIMGRFYPSGDNEESPFLEELEIIYMPSPKPAAPSNLAAITENGAVTLRWKAPAGAGGAGAAEQTPAGSAAAAGGAAGAGGAIGGYLVYYGTRSGEYLGAGSQAGDSPIDVGLANSVRIDNLTNGSLYYFSVAAYPKAGPVYAGDYSKEVSARPLRTELYD